MPYARCRKPFCSAKGAVLIAIQNGNTPSAQAALDTIMREAEKAETQEAWEKIMHYAQHAREIREESS